MIELIRSTSTPGAATAASEAAKELSIPCMIGMPSKNAENSHGTLLFISSKVVIDEEVKESRKACALYKKPLLEIPVWSIPDAVPKVQHVADLVRANGFKTLNIAGTKLTSDPPVAGDSTSGIYTWVYAYAFELFYLLSR